MGCRRMVLSFCSATAAKVSTSSSSSGGKVHRGEILAVVLGFDPRDATHGVEDMAKAAELGIGPFDRCAGACPAGRSHPARTGVPARGGTQAMLNCGGGGPDADHQGRKTVKVAVDPLRNTSIWSQSREIGARIRFNRTGVDQDHSRTVTAPEPLRPANVRRATRRARNWHQPAGRPSCGS